MNKTLKDKPDYCKLRELVGKQRPITYGILKPGPDTEDGVPYVRVVDMKDGTVLVDQIRRTTDVIAQQYARSTLKEGDILLSIRGHVGRVAMVPKTLDGANITQDTARIAVNGVCCPRYLFWFLQSTDVQQWMKRHTKGVAVKGINLGDVKELDVPLPPSHTQARIAAILDRADTIRRKREEGILLCEDLLRSTFLDMFGDPAANPKGWPMRTIADLSEVKTGATPSRDDSNNFGGEIPWVKTSEVAWSIVTDTEEKLTQIGFDSARGELYPVGSLLVALYGQGATRGRTALLGIPATTNQLHFA